jgi:Protein of unknown function (DUF763)/Protein of unknown function DUF72
MAKRAGSADLPLHGGRVPQWLADRMTRLGAVMSEAIVHHYGRDELLRRLANPFWFQSFGAVMGMDWHSYGITTSVIGALKRGLAPLERELGIHVCGGRGKYSRQTPHELVSIGERIGFNGEAFESKFITHWKRLTTRSVNSIELMVSRLQILGRKCGPVLFQLPPQFRANRERLANFINLLPVTYRYAFEFRHASEEPILELLRDHDIALCLSDHHDAPSPWIVTARHVYARAWTGRALQGQLLAANVADLGRPNRDLAELQQDGLRLFR